MREVGEYRISVNPGAELNKPVRAAYPDIVAETAGSGVVAYVIEVETEETVAENSAIEQWKEFSRLSRAFYLLVPASARDHAAALCSRHHIPARFGVYRVNEDGSINIVYE
jgi:hypothetical protein